jgi:hypothetical protein
MTHVGSGVCIAAFENFDLRRSRRTTSSIATRRRHSIMFGTAATECKRRMFFQLTCVDAAGRTDGYDLCAWRALPLNRRVLFTFTMTVQEFEFIFIPMLVGGVFILLGPYFVGNSNRNTDPC